MLLLSKKKIFESFLPSQEVWAVALGLSEVLDVIDAVHACWQAAIATVCVERLVKIADRNIGIGLLTKRFNSSCF
jgi:hypothetical protein